MTSIGSTHSDRRGAYGLAFRDPACELPLVAAGPSWPEWELRWEQAPSAESLDPQAPEEWGPERARLHAQPDGTACIERAARRTTLVMLRPPSLDSLAHPYMASTAVVANHWLGRTPFHSGAVIVNGRVWGVLGGREMGKTSLLAGLHRFGLPVFTDDVLVVDTDDGTAYAGPRCLDLREEAAGIFGCGRDLGVVGTRRRWRVDLPPCPRELPLGGWICLEWSSTVAVDVPDAATRLGVLAASRGLLVSDGQLDRLLEAVTFPMFRFARPRAWPSFDAALDQLLETISSA